MRQALAEAEAALQLGEVPVGAVVVHGDRIVGRAGNRRETWRDPTAHAELLALREAARTLGGWRLQGTTLYVTLEPCAMCAGALVLARVERLCFGAFDPKAGAVGSVMNVLACDRWNHRVEYCGGVLAEESAALLRRFFTALRRREPAGIMGDAPPTRKGARAVEGDGLENR